MLWALIAPMDYIIGENPQDYLYLGLAGLFGLFMSRIAIQALAGDEEINNCERTINVFKLWNI